ncbi:MAG: hypothetical protein AMXMBFR75_33360 [Candidatus Hinthialibacteria bacterium]
MSDYDVTTVDTTFLPQMTTDQAVQVYKAMKEFISATLVDGRDYGKIPGTPKATLLKAGAEKLCRFFGLSASMTLVDKVEDWTGADRGAPLFAYVYRCALSKNGIIIAECDGQANTWESRYGRQQQQPYAIINTVMKQSQKRAFVGAVLLACNASEYFTQDMEDLGGDQPASIKQGTIADAMDYLRSQGLNEAEIVDAWGAMPVEEDLSVIRLACREAKNSSGGSLKARLLNALNFHRPENTLETEVVE